jgi:hypothetical protein
MSYTATITDPHDADAAPVHTLSIASAASAPTIVTDHVDRADAVAALGSYLTATDRHPICNQLTTGHQSYDLICLARQRVAATATIEPTQTTPTDHGRITEAERDRLDAGAPVYLKVRPGTLSLQLCWREAHHSGDHESQDGQTWSSQ